MEFESASKQEGVKSWDLNNVASVHWESRGYRRTEDIIGDCQHMMTADQETPATMKTETSGQKESYEVMTFCSIQGIDKLLEM